MTARGAPYPKLPSAARIGQITQGRARPA
jgi:hypothetical protein